MARDLPDWDALTAQATVHEVTDLGELAVRLGSIVTHDRRGDVIWLDEFECGLGKWKTLVDGSDGSIALDTNRSRNGETSVLLTCATDGEHTAKIWHHNSLPAVSKVGVEASFMLGSPVAYVIFDFHTYDGDDHMRYRVWWDYAAETLSYQDSGGNTVVLASGVSLYWIEPIFHTAKLVCDMNADEFVRLILDATSYTMDGIEGERIGADTDLRITTEVRVIGRHGYNDTVYVDDVILTQNEPAEV